MPYITQEDRNNLPDKANAQQNGGELNYSISKLITGYIVKNGLNYQNISDVLGALQGAQAEFQRRVVNPYEDIKLRENGDLFNYCKLMVELQKKAAPVHSDGKRRIPV